MKVLTITICKCIQFILKKMGRGSSLPGQIALKLCPNILSQFKMPEKVIAVTGSSGKGSITSTIAEIARNSGMKVAHNAKGSNLKAGITTLLIENSNLRGKIKADIIIAEVDERYTKYVFPYLKPSHVIITNITRDQPPRQGHFDLVFEEIKKALTKDMHLILNADDPMLQKFNLNNEFKVSYYGIDKNKYSYSKTKFENLNFSYCPLCNKKLEYNYYNFEEIGDYYCPSCKFKKPIAKNICTKIDYNNNMITVNNNIKLHVPSSILYYIYNTLAAFTISEAIGIDVNNIIKSINEMNLNSKNINTYTIDDRIVNVLNNKNENSSTFNQSLLFVDRDKGLKTIVIGWKEISRRYNFNDLSWLYDINFEILAKHNIDKIVCVGLNKFDIATRIKYADIKESKIITFDNLEEAIPYIKKKTKGNIYAILNFDYVVPFNELINGGSEK